MGMRSYLRRAALLTALAVALVMSFAPAASAGAPATSTKASDSLYAEFDTLPNLQPGTHDIVGVLLGHSVWTTNGVVIYDWYNFEVYVAHLIWDEDFNNRPGSWAGHYVPPVPVAAVSFGPRSVSASRTLTWQCGFGTCPTMPTTIDVTVSGQAIGAPRTSTLTGPGSPGPNTGLFQQYDAQVTIDTDGAISVPPLVSWSTLMHDWSRTIED